MILSLKHFAQLWNQLLIDGGIIIPCLLMVVILIWWGLGSRFYILYSSNISVSLLWERRTSNDTSFMGNFVTETMTHRGELNWMATVCEYQQILQQHKKLIVTGIAIAPLLGLLGTVGGMIETFKGIGGSELFSQTGGVAGGIAQALLTTQMGLIVAVPGILLSRVLDKREERVVQTMYALIEKVKSCDE